MIFQDIVRFDVSHMVPVNVDHKHGHHSYDGTYS